MWYQSRLRVAQTEVQTTPGRALLAFERSSAIEVEWLTEKLGFAGACVATSAS
jgi:hypothetical protein